VTDLGSIGAQSSVAFDLNERGHAAGQVNIDTGLATPVEGADPPTHAALWRDGTITDLGTLGGLISTTSSLNDADQVAGDSETADGQTHAFLWDNGTMTDLGTLGGEFSRANGINDAGQVVGGAETADGTNHPFLWENGTMTDLGTVPGYNAARVIRNTENGLMCGFTLDPIGPTVPAGGERHAFFYRDGIFTDLGTLGGPNSFAAGLNSAGDVVGRSEISTTDATQPPHGFLWTDGVILDLNDLLVPGSGIVMSEAFGINESGQIGGGGILADGTAHAILLTPQT
jgi:probable HAF family extracellular repeat protein